MARKSRLRIIAGQWRGRHLDFYAADGLRPTGDRIRETLFNWLQGRVEGAVCLDLFAGSGALAFEAASRGARRVVMVENNPLTAQVLHEQIARFEADTMELWQGSALDYLRENQSAFDIILLDPPFASPFLQQSLELLVDRPHLNPGAFCYLEYPRREIPDLPRGWDFFRQENAAEVGYGLVRNSREDA